VVGLAPVFSTLHTNYAATIQRWLEAGTNVAEFTITNQQSCAIWLYLSAGCARLGPTP
jgi:hypothetical protein